ncbi:ras-related protein Rab-44-like isoform X2 [Rana temporaria]|uniref:ras-related protein Rab-44-like isoform X2 n=1 Tax=Rana temporaria TaxID=8407 RepID=UPI001AAD0B59|nr:ras-related protein Rab-44-like isoform X2 [Rana temporaria]
MKRSKGRKMGSSRRQILMETSSDQQPETSPKADEDPVFNEIAEKIQTLFSVDETSSNVHITRDDMEKVSGVVFCSVDELEILFDELSTDGKEYLTFEEFTSGLKNYIHLGSNQWNQKRKRKSTKRITEFSTFPSLEEADAEERKQFKSFMEQLGAKNIFEDETEIWKLWNKLSCEEPRLLENLEEFLAKVTSQIKDARKEKETLEIMLKKRIAEHNEEVQRLYEEMEQQMREEVKRLTHERDTRSSIHNKEMKNVIDVKNTEVQQLISVQDELERELHNLRSTEKVTKSENEKLKRTNQDLEHHLEKIRDQLSEAQSCLGEMKQKMIQIEDEKEATDHKESMDISSAQIFFQEPTLKDRPKEQEPEASDPQESAEHVHKVSNYTDDFKTSRSRVISIEEDPMPEYLLKDYRHPVKSIEEEKATQEITITRLSAQKEQLSFADSFLNNSDGDISPTSPYSSFPVLKSQGQLEKEEQNGIQEKSSNPKKGTLPGDISEDIKHHSEHNNGKTGKAVKKVSIATNISQGKSEGDTLQYKCQSLSEKTNSIQEMHGNPDHVYKIIFVGSTNVGKTSFLQRVYDGSFKKDVSATIGIDYHFKTLTIDNKQYVLQLWDTAGQERFHSITEQFFRKADGIVIMYDVTSRKTFTDVCYWLNRIQAKTVDDLVILLIGNKTDCDSERNVTYEDAEKLAQEYQLLFTECSAESGVNVMESLIQIARSLKEHEDNMKNNVVKIKRPVCQKETRCCV